MDLAVLGQMVRSREALITVCALEPLLTGVGSLMSRQLVRPGEALAAHGERALERPLSAVPSQVGLQVGRLAVDLAATFDVAKMLLSFS